jgi:ferredoxin-NADP reductase
VHNDNGAPEVESWAMPPHETTISETLMWRECRVVAACPETDAARTLGLDVPDWPGHLPGQRVDLRLTAPNGSQAFGSYSIASAAGDTRLELTVQRRPGDEVSRYLVDIAEPGDRFEVRGPVGRHFVWDPDDAAPVALAAGGSGIVPLMAMIRTRARLARRVPFRLLYATRGPADVIFAGELERHSAPRTGLELTYAYSRRVPPGWLRQPGRVDETTVAAALWPPESEPVCYVGGPRGFVERVAELLVEGGHSPARIRTIDGSQCGEGE